MKTRFFAYLTIILLLSASCHRDKGMFKLQGTAPQGTDTILVVGLDSRFEDIDTIFCQNGKFTWTYRPDTVTTLILILPDGRRHPVFAQKDVESFMTIPADTGLFSVTGGEYNDSYQSFYLSTLNDSTKEQTIAAIDSFITRDPFSEVTPFLIYDRLVLKYHAPENEIEALVKRMSGNMQDAPYLVSLKSDFNKTVTGNVYLENYTVTDSAGHKYQFTDIGGSANHLLVCVWASWMGKEGLTARDTLKYFWKKYGDRYFTVTDISIDVNRDLWKEAIKNDTVDWISYNDHAGWESKIVKTPLIQTAPAFVLFTGAKRVAYKTTSIEDLDKELEKTLTRIRVNSGERPPVNDRERLRLKN
jgi:hypothetical protein